MVPRVLDIICQFKILKSIVVLDAVNMMDLLMVLKFSAETFLHNNSMLKPVLRSTRARNKYNDVTGLIGMLPAVIIWIKATIHATHSIDNSRCVMVQETRYAASMMMNLYLYDSAATALANMLAKIVGHPSTSQIILCQNGACFDSVQQIVLTLQ